MPFDDFDASVCIEEIDPFLFLLELWEWTDQEDAATDATSEAAGMLISEHADGCNISSGDTAIPF